MKKSKVGLKIILFALLFSVVFPIVKPIQANTSQMEVLIDGEQFTLEILEEEGQLLVPLRDVFTAFESQIVWDGINRKLYTAKDNIISELQIGSNVGSINDGSGTFSYNFRVPPKLYGISNKAYVEIGFAEKALGVTTTLDSNADILTITSVAQQNSKLKLKREFVLTDQGLETNEEITIRYTVTPEDITQQEMGGVERLRPIVLEESLIPGEGEFELFSKQSPGNRGWLVLSDESLNGDEEKALFNQQLKDGYSEHVYVNDSFKTQTGSPITKIEDSVMEELHQKSIVVAIVNHMPNGQSNQVEITKFARLKLRIEDGIGNGAKEYTIYATFEGYVDGSRNLGEGFVNLNFNETFPAGLQVYKPENLPSNEWNITGTNEQGMTLTGHIPDMVYQKNGGVYRAIPYSFDVRVKPTVNGIFKLRDSKLIYDFNENAGIEGYFNALIANVVTPVMDIEIIDENSISLSGKTVPLEIGDSKTLSAILSPSNATNQNVIWEVDNPSALQITLNGKSATIEALNVLEETTIKVSVKSQENPDIYDECTVTITPNIPTPIFDIELSGLLKNNAIVKIMPDDLTIMENTKWSYNYNGGVWEEFYTGKFPNNTGTIGVHSDNLKKGDIIQIKASTPGVQEVIKPLVLPDHADKTQINIDIKTDQKIGTSGNRAARIVMSYKVTIPTDGIKGYRFIGKPQYEIAADNANHPLSGEFDISNSNKDGVNDDLDPVVKFIKSSTGKSFKINIKVKVKLLLETNLGEFIDITLDENKNLDVLSREYLR